MFTKKKYNSSLFSYLPAFSGISYSQIGNNFLPDIDKNVLIAAGIIIGAIVIFNFVYQHIMDKKLNSSKSQNHSKK